eukprot:Hpha_TRINITY_DN35502_c0_g1::TRINITY_DN35502_c0_g1_i1::g.84489::m.84489/K06950/K06950; uncharacterized protein
MGSWPELWEEARGLAGSCEWLGGVVPVAAAVLPRLRSLLEKVAPVGSGHGIDHAVTVYHNATRAVVQTPLHPQHAHAVVLAALLHDADDRKLFPAHGDSGRSQPNANRILEECSVDVEVSQLTVSLIAAVSCSSNLNSSVPPGQEWRLIPRDADRVEAIGEIGIVRAYQYTRDTGGPMFQESTPRASTESDLALIATPERFAGYRGKSASFVDHFYDKLLHIGTMASGSAYLQQLAQSRMQVMIEFVLEFGASGSVDTSRLEAMEREAVARATSVEADVVTVP